MREKNRNSIEIEKMLPQFTTMNVIDGQAGLINYSSLIFYSLTIDNILNIIVLLILAGVSIATLTGDNGILTRANDARESTEIGEEKDAIALAYNAVMTDTLGDGVEAGKLQEELRNNGYTNATAVDNGDGKIKVTFPDTDRSYLVDGNGNITEEGTGGGSGTGSLPSTDETSPFLPDGATVTEDDLDKGVTIKDSNNNEWVWIVVPKSITASASTDDEIKNALISYATDYREDYSDTWYDGCGLGEGEYAQKYSAMLQSIKTYGGFYIGKYEVGSFDEPVTSNDNTRQAVIQQGAYPYNYVTCSQAEDLVEGLATGGKTSTLMFGIQWDLVLTYLETSGGLTFDDLATDSKNWGNYADSTFPVAQGNKYAICSNWSLGEWDDIPANYTKPSYSSDGNGVLLSTGATERNSKMNIYDLAGNVWEWTLEKNTNTGSPCVDRGGCCYSNGSGRPASSRLYSNRFEGFDHVGFRPALY